MQQIIIENINLGGLADSEYLGVKSSVGDMSGIDIHSEPGAIKVNQALVKESGSTIDALVNAILPCSDGSTYLFGDGGKVWKRTSGGTYSLERTASPAAGSANIVGAIEDQGYVYYFTESRVGRWQVGTAWSGANDDWATFSITDASYHPAVEQNLVNYIGDGNYIAQIEDGVFTANALDLKTGLRVRSLGQIITELLVGTYVSDNVNWNKIFRWNTWSESFSSNDKVPERGVNAFLETDNFVVAQCGVKGNFYIYSNDRLERLFKIPGSWGVGNQAEVKSGAIANYFGIPLFGLSNIANNPAAPGIYSFGSHSPAYPTVLNREYIPSCGSNNTVIGAMAVVGDQVLVAWKNGSSYGVDKIDTSNKYDSSYIDTRKIMVDRSELTKVVKVNVCYRTLPENTDIEIKANINDAGFGSALTTRDDTDRKLVYTETEVGDMTSLKIRVSPVVDGNNAPEIERIEIILE